MSSKSKVAQPVLCEKCKADLSTLESVTREYVNKDGEPSVFSLGHYDEDGTFDPETTPCLSGGGFDLRDDSDSCSTCHHNT
jgi:hypothetical protein